MSGTYRVTEQDGAGDYEDVFNGLAVDGDLGHSVPWCNAVGSQLSVSTESPHQYEDFLAFMRSSAQPVYSTPMVIVYFAVGNFTLL